MRKWNAILSISIVAVLLIPIMMVGSIASACCGVKPVDLAVSDSPDPAEACIGTKVTISGTYTVIQEWTPFTPYDTGVLIKVFDPGGTKIVDKSLTLATGQTVAPKTFAFSDVEVVNKIGVYKYEVIAWSQNSFGRMQTDIVGGTITVRDTTPPKLIGCPSDTTLECDKTVPAPAVVTASDSCDPAPVVNFAEVKKPGACANEAFIIRTWKATDAAGNSAVCSQVITIVDTKAPKVWPVEWVNPSGKNVPPAGSSTLPGAKGGVNEDGFYLLLAEDNCAPKEKISIYVTDLSVSVVYGPFPVGTVIKLTEDPEAMAPECKKMGSDKDEVDYHIILQTDALIWACDLCDNCAPRVALVPPPPK